jgi:ABC-type bacteriocin/lantibiotic exporter with double-glycine peptidase domain
MIRQSSRQLYRQYQLERRKKREEKEKSPTKESSQKHARHSSHHGGASWHGGEGHGVSSHGERSTARSRSFATLFWQFLGLLRGHGMAIGFALATLTVSTLLKLVPPLGIKVVIDYVLVNRPLPSGWSPSPSSW